MGDFGRKEVLVPKLDMTYLWKRSRIDPKYWPELIDCQEWADELFEWHDAYPDDLLMPDRDAVFLSKHLPPTFASALLRRHLIRRTALRMMYARLGRPIS